MIDRITCVPYSGTMGERACAERHAMSYASRHVLSTVRNVGTYALCHPCIEGRDRMQLHGLVPVERMTRGVKIGRAK